MNILRKSLTFIVNFKNFRFWMHSASSEKQKNIVERLQNEIQAM